MKLNMFEVIFAICLGATFDLDRKVHYGSHCHNFVRK